MLWGTVPGTEQQIRQPENSLSCGFPVCVNSERASPWARALQSQHNCTARCVQWACPLARVARSRTPCSVSSSVWESVPLTGRLGGAWPALWSMWCEEEAPIPAASAGELAFRLHCAHPHGLSQGIQESLSFLCLTVRSKWFSWQM